MPAKIVVVTEELRQRKNTYVYLTTPDVTRTEIHNVTKGQIQTVEEVGASLAETLSHVLAIMPANCNLSITFQATSTN